MIRILVPPLDPTSSSVHAQRMQQRFFDELGFSIQQREDVKRAARQITDAKHHARLNAELRAAIANRDEKTAGALLFEGLQTFGPTYPLYLIQSCYDCVCSLYDALSIDNAIRIATLKDIQLWTDTYAQAHQQQTGLTQVFWIARHLCTRILRLGRLQFELKSLGSPVRVYKQKETGVLLAIAEANLACDQEGYLADREKAAFVTTLQEEASVLTAHTIDCQSGSIAHKPLPFETTSLSLLADSQTKVLHMHIPSGDKLSREVVDDSLLQAKTFFPTHSLVFCTSWLIDPALKQVAEPSSNIVCFMQRFSKFPVPFQTPQIFERVFSFTATEQDIPAWKATTSLQRSVQTALSLGVVFRTMGGYVLLEK